MESQTIFELIYTFIYNSILGGESEIIDTGNMATILTIVSIIFAFSLLIRLVCWAFGMFRVKKWH